MLKIKFSILFILSFFGIYAQVQNTLVERKTLLEYENYLVDSGRGFHSSIKPFLRSEIENRELTDSIEPSLFNAQGKKISLSFFPLLNLKYLYELNNSKTNFVGEGGLKMNIDIGKTLSLSASFLGGISEFLNYQDSIIKRTRVIPGIGYAYYDKEKYSYQDFSGYLSYSPNKIFNFQLGKGKNFFGDGYRSLLLSDNAPDYLYGRITTKIWKIKYVSLYTFLKDIRVKSRLKSDFKNKYATFHYLSWNITKKVNFSFFESVVWQGTDTNRTRNFDINYLNPVIFYRPVEYSLGSSDNAFVGFSFRLQLFKKQQLYGQMLLDEFLLSEIKARRGWWANKYGIQGGFKSFDLFGANNLTLQGEFNYVRPFTYSHASPLQNFGHFNQSLAHPLGANFTEVIGMLSYQYKRWETTGKLIITKYGVDSTGANNVGQNIYKSYSTRDKEFGNYIGQGLAITQAFTDLKASFLIHKKSGLRVMTGIAVRLLFPFKKEINTAFVYFGIKTPLPNFYDDY